MTNRQIVKELIDKGYKVEFTPRKDGSIRITKIEGKRGARIYEGKSSSSKGNAKARKLAGESLSEKQISQRAKPNEKSRRKAERKKVAKKAAKKRAKERKEKAKREFKKKSRLSESTKKMIRKAQRELTKKGKKGILKSERVKKHKAKYGTKSAKSAIRNIMIHEAGYAYPEAVKGLTEFLRDNFSQYEGTQEVIDALKPYTKYSKLLEDHILISIYDIYYDVGSYLANGKGLKPRDGANEALKLIAQNNDWSCTLK